MNIEQIENNLKILSKNIHKEEFVFDLLLAYGLPKATVTLLKKGRHNLSKQDGRIILKRKLFFQDVNNADLHETIDSLHKDTSTKHHSPRFIVVTDYEILLAVDTKTNEHLDIPIKNIVKYYDFFLPWAGIEKHRHTNENPADRKAAEKMAKLYDEILAENSIVNAEKIHDLNVFLSRLLFCFFAEDTNIFEDKLFTNSVASHTQNDGSDFSSYLNTLFDVLNSKDTSKYPQYLQKFPYVNGGLFTKKHWIPVFTPRSRKIIIECGELDWSNINPDIFGSMMQAVVHPSERGSLGMHYTSVPNIMKVIEPLFLNALREEFEKYKGNNKKLNELRLRMSKIKFFDPACGSGNFLIIVYKELRKLEMEIIKEMEVFSFSDINISQFYGIEVDDFAHEIAKLSLYLAEHQMNIEFLQEFCKVNPTLPLRTGGNIVCANATRIIWDDICPKNKNDEIYIMGNPPYLGSRNQNKDQKEDMHHVFKNNYKSLDYISCWFYLGAKYITGFNAKLAFVSTNSISQGEQVALLWPLVLKDKLEIFFAHQSFKWANNARRNAGVIVVIIGIQNHCKRDKKIFKDNIYCKVENINPYLAAGRNIFILPRNKPLSDFPEMNFGNMPADGGKLLFTSEEKGNFIKSEPRSKKWFRKLISAHEFLNGKERWCLWLKDAKKEELKKVPIVLQRINELKTIRKKSSRPELSQTPHLFAQITQLENKDFILIPCHSSENRVYIPIGFFSAENISHNSCLIVAGAEPFLFGILTSRMHMTWVRYVCGRLKSDYRYSKDIVYNNFPITKLTLMQKEELNRHVYNVLEEREKHSEKTLAQMYDPDEMPEGLKEAHHHLDLAVERCYRSKPFTNDEERLEYLFKLYEQMTKEEKSKNIKN
ncbi:MAG: N-6 DNA methylase [Candidatus Omnitrophica bacterium]|jgi:hypothetical protein|nr:N-6 DNA methylase [Candidatus Omnitrophota bacterium]